MKFYPKILLICNFNQRTANGITIKNLFKHWPKDNIAIADYNSCINDAYTESIEKYYILGNKETAYITPFNWIFKAQKSSDYTLLSRPIKKEEKEQTKSGLILWLKATSYGFLTYLLHAFGLSLVFKKLKISKEFKQWVHYFSPDIIYVNTANISAMNFFVNIKDEFNTKLVFHIFDDFLGSGNRSMLRLVRSFWLKKLDNTYRSLLAKTDLNFVISEKMGESYEKRYNEKYYSFHNPIDEQLWMNKVTLDQNKTKNDFFLFLYTGKINRDTASVLKSSVRAINSLNSIGYKIKLHIYTQTSYKFVYSLIGKLPPDTFKGFVKNDCLPDKLKNADGLLLPLSFSNKSIKYTRLSVATKATEYMFSKKPIFLFAPGRLAVTEYLSKHSAAYIVSDESKIQEAIVGFIDNEELRKQIANNAYNLAINRHLSKNVTEEIRILFVSMLSSNEINHETNNQR